MKVKILIILFFLNCSIQGFGRTYKKHDTCVYGKGVYVKDFLYKIPKGELTTKLQIVRRRAQEKCQGVVITDRYPDNGISQCLFYSHIATKGRHKGKRIICVNHACPGTKYEMDGPCHNYALKPAPKKTSEKRKTRSTPKPKKFVVKSNKAL
ncbi:hypothetical protein OAK75_02415 [Bacteriovoracales bacterium]|nr:hypothetical protein [Bacteriovoracales bacterium]